MNNLMAISLVPLAKKQLKIIIKEVMPDFARIRITSAGIVLQRRLFTRKIRISLIDFLMETLPKEINGWAQFKDIESPLPYFGNSAQFLLHLDAIGEKNIISYLWKCYMHVTTLSHLEAQPTQRVLSQRTVRTRVTTNVVANKVVRDLKRMQNNNKRLIPNEGFKHFPFDVVYRSPDIRGSPKLRSYFAKAG